MATTSEPISQPGAVLRIGDWLVEPSLNRMTRGDVAVQLELKAMDVLVFLAEHAGEVVSRSELQDAVWETEFVADNTLVKRIAQIREAFGDDARQPRYIETIPKRGYRLMARVIFDGSDEVASSLPEESPEREAEHRPPFPGLAPFTEADAADFFGREAEITALWRRITSRRLLAVIGASGAGKSSLLRAGVIARAPPGWRAVVCQPGEEPFLAMARALALDLADDPEEMRRLLAFQDPDVALAVAARWRGRWDEALVVIDQFEELFTLNAEPVCERFVELLRRLVDAAGIHLVLVLRDDFLLECHRYRQLAPIFSELTAVGPPMGSQLRRALTEPAARRLVGFESELLVDEMVAEVEAERGALPLLAFAVSRLWELRDRGRRLLTREAYERIGGVGGALAQHAEATVEAIGPERLPIVRELLRNLVTAQGTRAVRDIVDLLSVFGDGEVDEARAVLGDLVDARLLTSFDEEDGGELDSGRRRRVEIVHESLLASWPRLMRWRAQDAEGALLRDQLRQVAQLWQSRGKPADLLWTGASYREFSVWRERYPGGLSAVEEQFAKAMTTNANRTLRRRRLAVATALVAMATVAASMTALWRSAEHQARRVEARRLFEIGRRLLDRSPPLALAWSMASLEFEDDPGARRIALSALWASPMPWAAVKDGQETPGASCEFSPNGRWLATGDMDGVIRIWPSSGSPPVSWKAHPGPAGGHFSPDSRILITSGFGDAVARVWSVPDGRPMGEQPTSRELLATDIDPGEVKSVDRVTRLIEDPGVAGGWRLDLRPSELRRRLRPARPPTAALSPDGAAMLYALGAELFLIPVKRPDETPLPLGSCRADVLQIAFSPDGELVATYDASGETAVWARESSRLELLRSWQDEADEHCTGLLFHPSGRYLARCFDGGYALIHGLDDPPGADPLRLDPGGDRMIWMAFHPDGRWLATASLLRVALWPFERDRYPFVLRGHSGFVDEVAFTADGSSLLSCGVDGTVRLWPLHASPSDQPRVLYDWGHTVEALVSSLTVSGDGSVAVATGGERQVRVIPLDGRPQRDTVASDQRVYRATVSFDGRLVAFPGRFSDRNAVLIMDLVTGAVKMVDLPDTSEFADALSRLAFTRDGKLLVDFGGQLLEWDPATREERVVMDGSGDFATDREGRTAISRPYADGQSGFASIVDLDSGESKTLHRHGPDVVSVALDGDGRIAVTGRWDGSIRVGPVTGDAPQTLVTTSSGVASVAVSPDGAWIASGHRDGTIRLWPMPDLDAPPILDLPRRELLAKLGSLTNLRAVPDPARPPGWYAVRATEPYPGWEVPAGR